MKTRISLFAAAALCLACTAATAAPQAGTAVPERLKATIDARQTAAPISKYLYGGFIEQGGTLIYRSLWSEMLDDRKFYFPISSKVTEEPTRRAGPPFRMPLRKWVPVGPDEVVVMDKDHPFVGEQSPRIELNTSTSHGIRQSGLALVKGQKYTCRISLRGTRGAKIKFILIWG